PDRGPAEGAGPTEPHRPDDRQLDRHPAIEGGRDPGPGQRHHGPGLRLLQHLTALLFAEVAVEAARAFDHGTYTYAVPGGLELAPGHRVWVPFGRRGSYGYVTELHVRDPGIEV